VWPQSLQVLISVIPSSARLNCLFAVGTVCVWRRHQDRPRCDQHSLTPTADAVTEHRRVAALVIPQHRVVDVVTIAIPSLSCGVEGGPMRGALMPPGDCRGCIRRNRQEGKGVGFVDAWGGRWVRKLSWVHGVQQG
jgi:hypothetical protein